MFPTHDGVASLCRVPMPLVVGAPVLELDGNGAARTAKTVDEACALVKARFEYVIEVDSTKLFGKRK